MKKQFLKLGSFAAIIAPIATVISCGINLLPTDDELATYASLTSTEALRILENQWQYLVLDWPENDVENPNPNPFASGLNQNFKYVKDVPVVVGTAPNQIPTTELEFQNIITMAKKIIAINIAKDPKYLQTFGNKLLSSGSERLYQAEVGAAGNENNVYSEAWLRTNGLLRTYNFGISFEGDSGSGNDGSKLTNDALRLLLIEDRISFKTSVLKALVVKEYFANVTKSQWGQVYPEALANLNTLNLSIDSNYFLIIKEMLQKKYFAKWEITLEPEDIHDFIDDSATGTNKEDNFVNSYNSLKSDGYFGLRAKFSEKTATLNSHIFDFDTTLGSTTYKGSDLVGYTGIGSQGSADGALEFTNSSYQEVTSYDDWTGFLTEDNKFIVKAENDDESIAWLAEKAEAPKLTFVKGIMPVYANIAAESEAEENRLTFIPLKNASDEITKTADEIAAEIIDLFATLDDGSLYDQAMDYYITEIPDGDSFVKEAIILEILNEEYKNVLDDKFSLKFINAKEIDED